MTIGNRVKKYIADLERYIPTPTPKEKRGALKGINEEKRSGTIYIREDCIHDLPTLRAVVDIYKTTKSVEETHRIISERYKLVSIEEIKEHIEDYEKNKKKFHF